MANQDFVISREYLRDQEAQLSIQDILQAQFEPAQRRISKGFSPAAHWIRITVAPAGASMNPGASPVTNGNPEAILRVRPTFLDDIRLYEQDPKTPGGWSYRQAGDRFPFGPVVEAPRSYSFKLNLQDQPSVFYVRVVTSSTLWADITVMSPTDTRLNERTQELIQVVYLTVMAMVFVWALVDFLQFRQPLVGLFAAHQLGLMLYSMAIFGFHMNWISHEHAPLSDLMTSISVIGTGILFLIFSYRLFREYAAAKVYLYGMLALIGLSIFNLLLLLLGHNGIALKLNSFTLIVGWAYMLAVALRLPPSIIYGRNHIRVAYGAIFALMMFFQAMVLGVFPVQVNLAPLVALFVYGVVGSALFWSLMINRSKLFQRELDRAAFELQVTEKTLELEKELKKKALDEARTDFLTGLLTRRRFTEGCEREIERAIRYERPLSLMLIDIDHFKAVNDQHGHLVGDHVIQHVALCLRQTVREIDLVGRVGGEEFGVLLAEADARMAMDVARRIHKNLESKSVSAGQSQMVKVTVSIGLCSIGPQNANFEALFFAADQALYRAKQAGRNTTVAAD